MDLDEKRFGSRGPEGTRSRNSRSALSIFDSSTSRSMLLTPTTTFKQLICPVDRSSSSEVTDPLDLTGASGNSKWSSFWCVDWDNRIMHTGIRWEGAEVGEMKGCESVVLKVEPHRISEWQVSSLLSEILEEGVFPPTTDGEFAGPSFDLATVPVTHSGYFVLTFEITMPLTVHHTTGVPTVGKVYTG